jgi:hypothetical protein
MLVVVALEPVCVPTMCFLKILNLWAFCECLKIIGRVSFFYHIPVLSRHRIFFTAYSVDVEFFLPL